MKTLSTQILTESRASQSAWCEVFDFYLKAAITTPYGTTNIVRITDCPGGLAFFAPTGAPEPVGSQSSAQNYVVWPVKRQVVKSSSKISNDKFAIAVSNVTGDWATMLAGVDWYDVPVCVRKVSMTIVGPSATDCATVFIGKVDSVKVLNDQLQFACSNDFGNFATTLPDENMHASCRFAWGDDFCTALKFSAANYKSKTCAGGSSTSVILSAGLTEDTGASGSYGTDLVDALSDGAITTSSEQVGFEGYRVRNSHGSGAEWAFGTGSTTPTLTNENYYPWIRFDFGSAVQPVYWVTSPLSRNEPRRLFDFAWSDNDVDYTLAATSLSGTQTQVGSNWSIEVPLTASHRYWRMYVRIATGGAFTVPVLGVTTAANTRFGTDRINPLANSAITTSSQATGNEGYQVRSSNAGTWLVASTPAPSALQLGDWGYNQQGYWRLPDTQAGLANALLTPWIQFDFGSAGPVKVWQINTLGSLLAGALIRTLVFFSSNNGTTWKHETYYEVPNAPGVLRDVLIPGSQHARYWRICVRNTWSAAVIFDMLGKAYAYAGSRQYWRKGLITFDGNVTAALTGVARAVIESYSGEAVVAPLPVAPAAGDTFTIQRGCSRTFNACCERGNWENFGGFTTLPDQTVVRS